MKDVSVLFFGSTTDSVIVLDALSGFRSPQWAIRIAAVVTQPPKPVGRQQTVTETPVAAWAKSHDCTVLTFPADAAKPWLYEDETRVIDTLESVKAGLIVSASYGQKIPAKTIADAPYGGLNVHPSLLPRWRGGDPVPWAILTGDRQTGVTVVSLSEKFDEGIIYAQEKIPITDADTSTPLRTRLFGIGAGLLTELLPGYFSGKAKGKPQKTAEEPRARRLTRELGFEPWESLMNARTDEREAARIGRKFRALHPWPGLWTIFDGKRLKILGVHTGSGGATIDTVQLEGKKPVTWSQFAEAYLPA